jgi:hypothetical protein
MFSTLAGEGCIIDGGTIRWEKFFLESPRGHIVCGVCHAFNRFVLTYVNLNKY